MGFHSFYFVSVGGYILYGERQRLGIGFTFFSFPPSHSRMARGSVLEVFALQKAFSEKPGSVKLISRPSKVRNFLLYRHLGGNKPHLCRYHRASTAARASAPPPPPSSTGCLPKTIFVFPSAGEVWRRLGIGFACFFSFAMTASRSGYPLDR